MNEQIQYQIRSAIGACQARIENGSTESLAFDWLNAEIEHIFKGEVLYPEDEN